MFSLHVHVYLDDWLFRHMKRDVLRRFMSEILDFICNLSWQVNLDKSSLVSSQSFKYLGLHFVTDLDLIRPADHLLVELEHTMLEICAHSPVAGLSAHEIYSILAVSMLGSLHDQYRSSAKSRHRVVGCIHGLVRDRLDIHVVHSREYSCRV